ncbi:discoidin domain-containing protein [Bacteroides neonati]|uniref:discoidin domain-containing protein n=1 Tax=Bacteroides neonati TaxID=1347393 RepID=UPI0004ADF957|nr:discoidin domain-containing protein [Bacteroides neonati]
MKKNTLLYIIPACIILLTSCSKELSYEGEYDVKSYYNGVDPRQNLVFFSQPFAEIIIPFIGTTSIGAEVEASMLIATTRPVEKDNRFALEVLKSDDIALAGYQTREFIGVDKVKIAESTCVIPAGMGKTTAKLSVNMEGLKINSLLPVRLVKEESSVFFPSTNRGLQLLTFKDEQVITLKNQVFEKAVTLTSKETIVSGGTKIDLSVLSSLKLKEGYTVNLVRADEVAKDYPGRLKDYQLAPDNMFPKFDAKSLDEVNVVDFSFELKGLNQFTEAKKIYMPMKIVIFDKDGKNIELLKNKADVLIQLDIDVSKMVLTTEELTTALSKEGWSITASKRPNLAPYLIDGINSREWYGSGEDVTVTLDMKGERRIDGVMLENTSPYPSPTGYTIYVSNDGVKWEKVSNKILASTKKVTIKSLETINAHYMRFSLSFGSYGYLTEITVYGK